MRSGVEGWLDRKSGLREVPPPPRWARKSAKRAIDDKKREEAKGSKPARARVRMPMASASSSWTWLKRASESWVEARARRWAS